MTDVETPSPRDPAYRGTMLGTWSQTAVQGGPPASQRSRPPASSTSDLRFQAISRLGEGAMGAIDIARDVYLRRKVALKTVLPEMAGHPEIFGRFLSEMQITAQLEHPNIVPVYALDVSADGSLGYAMKLVQGRDLEAILTEARAPDREGRAARRRAHAREAPRGLPQGLRRGRVRPLAGHRPPRPQAGERDDRPAQRGLPDGLGHRAAHRRGQPGARGGHRDAGPEGPFEQRRQPHPPRRRHRHAAIHVARAGAGKNPELDGKSDQYALGLILQECVTLRTAVDGATLQEVLAKAMLAKRDPAPIGNRPGALPPEIDAIVRRATRPEPEGPLPLHPRARRRRPALRSRRTRQRAARRRAAPRRPLALPAPHGHPHARPRARPGGRGGHHRRARGRSSPDRRAAHARAAREPARRRVGDPNAARRPRADPVRSRPRRAGRRRAARPQQAARERRGAVLRGQLRLQRHRAADLAPSKRYRRDVSLLAPVTSIFPSDDRAARDQLQGLLAIPRAPRPGLPGGHARIVGGRLARPLAADQRTLIADIGVPAFRASIVLGEGATLSFPGMAARPPTDPRLGAPFKLAEGKQGVVWGTATMVDGEPILPATAAPLRRAGAFRGVAILEVSLTRLLAAARRSSTTCRAARSSRATARSWPKTTRLPAACRSRRRSSPRSPPAERHARRRGGRAPLPVRLSPARLDRLVLRRRRRGRAVDREQRQARDERSAQAVDAPSTPPPRRRSRRHPRHPRHPRRARQPFSDAGAAVDAGEPPDAGAPRKLGRRSPKPPADRAARHRYPPTRSTSGKSTSGRRSHELVRGAVHRSRSTAFWGSRSRWASRSPAWPRSARADDQPKAEELFERRAQADAAPGHARRGVPHAHGEPAALGPRRHGAEPRAVPSTPRQDGQLEHRLRDGPRPHPDPGASQGAQTVRRAGRPRREQGREACADRARDRASSSASSAAPASASASSAAGEAGASLVAMDRGRHRGSARRGGARRRDRLAEGVRRAQHAIAARNVNPARSGTTSSRRAPGRRSATGSSSGSGRAPSSPSVRRALASCSPYARPRALRSRPRASCCRRLRSAYSLPSDNPALPMQDRETG